MERLPPLDPAKLTDRQKRLFDKIAGGPRGGVAGPFNVLLRCPGVADPVQELGRYLRFEGVLPGPLRELAILVTARFWTAQYEWYAHARIAREEGVDGSVIEAIADDTTPDLATPQEIAVYNFCRELHADRMVSDECYTQAVDTLGPEAVIELTVLAGYYAMISMILNTFEIPLPDGVAPPLAAVQPS
ncbi:MAG: carboxymuconolactone decarboxylase family protein [Kiloniellales bacterium]